MPSSKPSLSATALRNFEANYDHGREDVANRVRGEFISAFPRAHLDKLRVDDYVIGHKRPTFCDFVEAKTRAWANILGATAFKFGIYYGRTKSDPRVRYRFTKKFGETEESAFKGVKTALLDLIDLGEKGRPDFAAIDANPLSQLFKAKILSLYYPQRFINVCSAEHLEGLTEELGLRRTDYSSEQQYQLIRAKRMHPVTRSWSNPKFMAFLYETYVRPDTRAESELKPPKKRAFRRVNFEDMQEQWGVIGRLAEEYALRWEKDRLSGAQLGHLATKIEDVRDRPGNGFDFLSHSTPSKQRFIEVKSVGKLPGNGGHRFFLTENERRVSESPECRDDYYFYLVFFDQKGHPANVRSVIATDLYKFAQVAPAAHIVRFDMGANPLAY